MSADNPWKPCDLRGVFPSAVSESLFRRVGAAIGSEIPEESTAVVGGDFRASTPALKNALADGLTSTGLHVIDVGLLPTPIVYFQASRMRAAAVFIVNTFDAKHAATLAVPQRRPAAAPTLYPKGKNAARQLDALED